MTTEPMNCDGKCPKCEGEVKPYRVVGPAGVDYGTFNYCDEAARRDREKGFAVIEVVTWEDLKEELIG